MVVFPQHLSSKFLVCQAAAGLKESLSYYQDLLGWLSDLIQWIYELFQWKNPVVTKTVRFVTHLHAVC